jgi:hypothetical protein
VWLACAILALVAVVSAVSGGGFLTWLLVPLAVIAMFRAIWLTVISRANAAHEHPGSVPGPDDLGPEDADETPRRRD